MTDPAVLCAALIAAHTPSLGITEAQALRTCRAVVRVAVDHGHDPAVLASMAAVESRLNGAAVSRAGARGPLQVLPELWCPGAKLEGCNLLKAGARAWTAWKRTARRTMGPALEDALCLYSHGRRYKGGGCQYADRVLFVLEQVRGARAPPSSPESLAPGGGPGKPDLTER